MCDSEAACSASTGVGVSENRGASGIVCGGQGGRREPGPCDGRRLPPHMLGACPRCCIVHPRTCPRGQAAVRLRVSGGTLRPASRAVGPLVRRAALSAPRSSPGGHRLTTGVHGCELRGAVLVGDGERHRRCGRSPSVPKNSLASSRRPAPVAAPRAPARQPCPRGWRSSSHRPTVPTAGLRASQVAAKGPRIQPSLPASGGTACSAARRRSASLAAQSHMAATCCWSLIFRLV